MQMKSVKISSQWIRKGPDPMTGVLRRRPCKERQTDTHAHIHERWLRNTKELQEPPGAERGKAGHFPGALVGARSGDNLTLVFQLPAGEGLGLYCSKPPVRGVLLLQPLGTHTIHMMWKPWVCES